MRIVLTGGGTLGSVVPLVAVVEELKKRDDRTGFLWVGTKNGQEKEFVESYGIPFQSISSGKLRRYFDLKNLYDPIKILIGFFEALWIIFLFKPDIILGAGSFVSVPVFWAGWLLKKKLIIHQQDIKKSLTNKILEPMATKITVSFKPSLEYFSKEKTVLIGNPWRKEILKGNISSAYNIFNLEKNFPVVLILGGGTGAMSLNEIVIDSLDELLEFCQVIHLTGKNKNLHIPIENKFIDRYHPRDFLRDEIKEAYAVSDVIVSRGGMATLTELSVLSKPVIIIPLRDTHQGENAKYLEENKAAIVLQQERLTPQEFVSEIKKLLDSEDLKFTLSKNIRNLIQVDSTEKFIYEILNI